MTSKRSSPDDARAPRRLLSMAVILSAATLLHHAARGAPPDPAAAAAHGEQPPAQQIAALDKLLGQEPWTRVPAGVAPSFWKALLPDDNQPNEARFRLGKKLYFDPRLSRDGTVSCSTCHDVSRGLTDRRNASEGIGGKVGRRNAPTTMNTAFFSSLFLDGRAASLEEQAKLPILNPIEMGQPDGAAVVAGIGGDAEYVQAFKDAYGRAVNYDDVGRALAVFERALTFLGAPFDRFAGGDLAAMSDDAKAGWSLFQGKARCASCHQMPGSMPVGTDNRFHNIGVSARHQDFEKLATQAITALEKSDTKETMDQLALQSDMSELGRFVVTRNRSDIGAFKTSQLRNIGVTAPYMHDGSMQTLWDVVDHYNKGGEANPYLDGGVEPLALDSREIDQLVAFLFALTDDRLSEQNQAEMERQKKIAADKRPFRDDARASRKELLFERRATGEK